MFGNDSEGLWENARRYAERRSISVARELRLGYGSDGTVWKSSTNSAVKAVSLDKNFRDERDSYLRLRDAGVTQIGVFAVPTLIDHDDSLRVVEMEIVRPPYLLDFGKVYLDQQPPYWDDEHLMSEVHDEWRQLFDQRWPDVEFALGRLRQLGIFYADPKPANIDCGD